LEFVFFLGVFLVLLCACFLFSCNDFLDVCCLCVRYNADPFYLRRMYLTRQSSVAVVLFSRSIIL
jgi:hypothetical protein